MWVHPEALPFDTQAAQFPASAHDDLLDASDIALPIAAERGSEATWGVLCAGAGEAIINLAQAHADWMRLTGGYNGNWYGL